MEQERGVLWQMQHESGRRDEVDAQLARMMSLDFDERAQRRWLAHCRREDRATRIIGIIGMLMILTTVFVAGDLVGRMLR